MNLDIQFESFLDDKNDRIDCYAYDLLCLLATPNKALDVLAPSVGWDVELIEELVDCAEKILAKRHIPVCRPFYEGNDEIPCYLGEDCKRKDCQLRQKLAQTNIIEQ